MTLVFSFEKDIFPCKTDLDFLIDLERKKTNNLSLLNYYTRHFKKVRLTCYSLHSKNRVRVSVRPTVRPSVRLSAHHFHSLLGAFFNQFSLNLV